MSNDRDEPFLSRWSRQKQQQVKQPEAKPKVAAPGKPGEPEPEIDLSKLTKVEDVTAESDITQFLQKGVPEALQKLALRKMWSLDPAIRDFVEVAENQWDFNMPGGIHGLFEEVAEGTDVRVWMAQATQSVFGDDAKKPVEAVADGPHSAPSESTDAAASNVAVQNDANASPAPEILASLPAVAPAPAVPVRQAAVVIQGSDTPQGPPRRRHGGALPA